MDNLPDLVVAAFDRLPVGILLIDPEGTIVLSNSEIERVFGWVKSELLGQTVDALLPNAARLTQGPSDGFARRPRLELRNQGRDVSGRRKDGSEVPVDVTFNPLRVASAEFVLVSIVDLTDRRRVQADLQRGIDERSALDVLARDLAIELIEVPGGDVDRRIEDALGRVGRTLGLDQCTLFRILPENGDFVRTHHWTRPGWAPLPSRIAAQPRLPWHLTLLRAGDVVSFDVVDDVPNAIDRDTLRRIGIQSGLGVPLMSADRAWGLASFACVNGSKSWTPPVVTGLRLLAVAFAHAIARQHSDAAAREQLAEATERLEALRDENVYLRRELSAFTGAPAIVAHSGAMRRVLELVRGVAATDAPILLRGEPGTGKALLAGRIHELSPRGTRPIVRVACVSLSAESIERDLIGTALAHPDAGSGSAGRLRIAHGSTLFLEHVDNLSLDAQSTLARVLEEPPPRTGSRRGRPDVRIIASTPADLGRAVSAGTFRRDLYQSLNAHTIQIAPLRERPEDIPPLVWRFVDEFTERNGKVIEAIDRESMAALARYKWPGNARELRNVVERAVMLAQGRLLRIPTAEERTAAKPRRLRQRR